jgi:hypothetical protein
MNRVDVEIRGGIGGIGSAKVGEIDVESIQYSRNE